MRCVGVCWLERSLRLHLEKILIDFQHIVKPWKANLMILVCFFDWMNSHRRKFKVWHCYSSFGQCLSLECIVAIRSCGQTKTDGGDNALNLQPQRRGVQRLIQDRVEDLRFFRRRQKASASEEESLCEHLRRCPSTLPASSPGEAARPAVETLRSL